MTPRLRWAALTLAGLGCGGTAMAQASAADSAVAAACAAGGGVADGLLVVEFRADLTPEQRSAIARDAGGRIIGAGGEGDYIAVPAEGRAALDAAADRLIRVNGVQAVGGAACPAPAPRVVTPADSARSDSAARAPAPADSAAFP